MALRATDRTHPRPDLVLAAVHERIAELHASARSSRAGAGSPRGRIARLRDAVGSRLIALGSALVTEEPARRRPALRS